MEIIYNLIQGYIGSFSKISQYTFLSGTCIRLRVVSGSGEGQRTGNPCRVLKVLSVLVFSSFSRGSVIYDR